MFTGRPADWSPIGVLLTGGRFREDWCLDAAEAIERLNAAKTLMTMGPPQDQRAKPLDGQRQRGQVAGTLESITRPPNSSAESFKQFSR